MPRTTLRLAFVLASLAGSAVAQDFALPHDPALRARVAADDCSGDALPAADIGARYDTLLLLAHCGRLHEERAATLIADLDRTLARGDLRRAAVYEADAWRLARRADDNPQALARIAQAIELRRRALGDAAHGVFVARQFEVTILHGGGRYAEALVKSRALVADAERRIPGSRLFVDVLSWHAQGLYQAGYEDDALATFDRALALCGRIVGPSANACIGILGRKANALRVLGRYAESRDAWLARRDLNVAAHGPQYWDVGADLFSIALTLQLLGDYAGAEDYYAQSMRHFATSPPPDRAYLTWLYNNYAEYRRLVGDLAGARTLMQQSLALKRDVFGATHTETIGTQADLAVILAALGDVDAAVALFDDALRQRERTLGAQHPATTRVVSQYARAMLAAQRDDAAAVLVERALAARRVGAQGERQPQLRGDYLLQARLHALRGDDRAALAAALKAESLRAAALGRAQPQLSTPLGIAYQTSLRDSLDLAVELGSRSSDARDVAAVWDAVIARRGALADLAARRLALARDAASPEQHARWQEWQRANAAYVGALVASERGERGADAALRLGRAALDAAETRLGRWPGSTLAAADAPDLARLRRALPAATSLVAYFRSGAAHDYAFVLDDAAAAPRLVDLGASPPLDALAHAWYDALSRPGSTRDERDAPGRALRERLWDPLRVAPGRRVLVVPDGAAAQLNLAALPAGDGYLVETTGLHVVEQERALATAAVSAPLPRRLVLVGAPAFAGHAATAVRAPHARCLGATHEAFPPLPGTLRETQRLQQLFATLATPPAVVALTGDAADEPSLRRAVHDAELLHLATHGFHFDGDCAGTDDGAQRGLRVRTAADAAPARPALAGVALSGADVRAADVADDGLWTAEEIAALDLRRVRWVVLSACDTGRGRLAGEEGLIGLRRAFRLAGAHSVIASLWRVDDEATASWMAQLYEARFRGAASTLDAMTAAQRATIAALRAQGRDAHPYYWAAFVASGDWR